MSEENTLIPVVGKKYKNKNNNDIVEILCKGLNTYYIRIIQSDIRLNVVYEYAISFENFPRYFEEYKEPISKSCIVVLIRSKTYKFLETLIFHEEMKPDQIKKYYDHMGYEVLSSKHITLTEGEFSE